MSLSNPASLDWNAAPDKFISYNASINVPSSSPNYGPANFQIFSLQSSIRYAFCISQAILSRLFNTLVDNVNNMSETCFHKRHVLVISGRHAYSANNNYQISRVVSKFGVMVWTTSVVIMTNHKWPVISHPPPFLIWWYTHAIHSSQTACSPGWIGWSWSCVSRKGGDERWLVICDFSS